MGFMPRHAQPAMHHCIACTADLPGADVVDGAGTLEGQKVHLHDFGPGHGDVAAHAVKQGRRYGRAIPRTALRVLAEMHDNQARGYTGTDLVAADRPFGDAGTTQVWTDTSEWQGRAYDASYPHTFASYRVTLGTTYLDRVVAGSTGWCHANAGAGKRLLGHMGYHVWYPGGEAQQLAFFLAHAAVDPFFVAMIDIESWSGQIIGDHSPQITSLATALAAKLGQQRVKVYGNQGDLASIYPHRPPWLGLVKASYSSQAPAEPWDGWQYSDGATQWPVPTGWPRASAPFGPCDHNAFIGTATQLASTFGLGAADMPIDQTDANLIVKTLLTWKMSPGGVPDPDGDFGHIVIAGRNWARSTAAYTNTLEPSLAALPSRTDLANAVADVKAAIPTAQQIADIVVKAVPVGTLTDAQVQAIATAVAAAQPKPPKPPVYTATLIPGDAAAIAAADGPVWSITDATPGTDGQPLWDDEAPPPAAETDTKAEK